MSKHRRVEPVAAPYKPMNNTSPPVKIPADELRKHLRATTLPPLEQEHRTFRQVLDNLRRNGKQGKSLGVVMEDATFRIAGDGFRRTRIELKELEKKDKVKTAALKLFDERQSVLSMMNPRRIMERRALVKDLSEIRSRFNQVAETYNENIKDLNTPSKKDEIKREAIKGLRTSFRDSQKMERGEREVSRLEKEIVNYRIMDRRLEKLRQEPVQIEGRDLKVGERQVKTFRVTEDLRERLKSPQRERSLKR